MTDKCKGRTYDRNIPWGDKRVPCRRNAGPSGYCHQHEPRPTEPDESLGVLYSLRYDGHDDNAASAFTFEDVPILSRTAKLYRVPCGQATAYRDTIALGDDPKALTADDDRTIVVVGTDKRLIRAFLRGMILSRADIARRRLEQWESARAALDQQESP